MSFARPIVMLEVDGIERAFFADIHTRCFVSIDDPREWYRESAFNGTSFDEIVMYYTVTEH